MVSLRIVNVKVCYRSGKSSDLAVCTSAVNKPSAFHISHKLSIEFFKKKFLNNRLSRCHFFQINQLLSSIIGKFIPHISHSLKEEVFKQCIPMILIKGWQGKVIHGSSTREKVEIRIKVHAVTVQEHFLLWVKGRSSHLVSLVL